MLTELWRSGLPAQPLAAMLLLLAGFLATRILTQARRTDPSRIGLAARRPQAALVPALALPASALAWWLRPRMQPPLCLPHTGFLLGGGAIAASFLLLVIERRLAATREAALPEAPALRALAFVATCVTFGTGLLEIAANLGAPGTGVIGAAMALVVAGIGVEMSLRALARLFLPPPVATEARAAVASAIARIVANGAAGPGALGAPLRRHLGIDFSRSWALAYLRGAALPMLGVFLLLAWGLSGATLVELDRRAIYERFGAPVRVLQPGLHVGLPWPLGTTRSIDYGAVHEIGLGPTGAPIARVGAEDAAPASADRLWEQAHPAEIDVLIASQAAGRQSFQSVSADLRILYRVGLTDADAIRAAYATTDPDAFVRAAAGQMVAASFADRTLDQVLGGDRQAMADSLCRRLQDVLSAQGSGLQAVAVVIEAIHPPAGAAEAYHNVRAAEIAARASVAVERGAAATILAQSQQYAFAQISAAQGAGAEAVEAARTAGLRFVADEGAAQAGGKSFLVERYFGALSAALGRAPKTIVDHRLIRPDSTVLDLRPFAAASGTTGGKEE